MSTADESAGCTYRRRCTLYANRHRLAAHLRTTFEASFCHDGQNYARCRRAQYHSLYGDDPPLDMLPVSVKPDGRVWIKP